MSTADTVLHELENITGTDQVRKDLNLDLFGEKVLDSFGTVELIVALSDAFSLDISPGQIDRELWATPQKIIDYFATEGKAAVKQAPHLISGLAALLVSAIAAIGFTLYSQSTELRYVNALVPLNLELTLNGLALQRAGLHKPDLLPMLGSSEVTLLENQYHADKFFETYPTGFTVMGIANFGAASITMAQDLAALGTDLNGKKVAISFSPANFTLSKLPPAYYAGNYSRLHVYEALFSPYISSNLKATIARRTADFPDTYKDDPFLNFAIVQLTGTSRINRAFYYLSWPLAKMQIEVMRLQDHAIIISYIASNQINPEVSRKAQAIDWTGTLSKALTEQKLATSNNSFGVENANWWAYENLATKPAAPGSDDKDFIQRVSAHPEWNDLDILLQVLKELGAEPLILSRPMNVHLWEAKGVSEQAQNTFYTRLHEVADPYHFTLIDYQKFGTDIYFSVDQGSHTSREGWIYVNQTLDDFFHSRLH